MFTPSPTQDEAVDVLNQFLIQILPAGTEIVIAQDNRVPEPLSDNFVVMTPMFKKRLSTNVDVFDDSKFTASIAGNVMNVTAVELGVITIGNQLFGTGVLPILLITSQLSGSAGGTGTYQLSGVAALSGVFAAGAMDLNQSLQFTVQLDVHGPSSGDNAVSITTIFRDEYAYTQFQNICAAGGLAFNSVVPLYADDARQSPFINDQDQFEWRWTIDAEMQVNVVVLVPQQYADAVKVDVVSVEASYP